MSKDQSCPTQGPWDRAPSQGALQNTRQFSCPPGAASLSERTVSKSNSRTTQAREFRVGHSIQPASARAGALITAEKPARPRRAHRAAIDASPGLEFSATDLLC